MKGKITDTLKWIVIALIAPWVLFGAFRYLGFVFNVLFKDII